jgi:hypothetical protein
MQEDDATNVLVQWMKTVGVIIMGLSLNASAMLDSRPSQLSGTLGVTQG